MDETCTADDLKEINRFGHQYFEIARANMRMRIDSTYGFKNL